CARGGGAMFARTTPGGGAALLSWAGTAAGGAAGGRRPPGGGSPAPCRSQSRASPGPHAEMRRRVAATMSSRPTGIRKASIIREGGDPRISGQTLVPKKGLEPPHPCGYMDLNHARLPIPPLRQVDYFARLPCGIPVLEEQLSILQTLPYLSNHRSRPS